MNSYPQIEIRPLNDNDFFPLMECHLLTFAHDGGEAMMNALGISPADSESFSRFVCEKAIAEGVSMLAWDHEAEQVAGFCINEPFATIADFTKLPMGPKFTPLFLFLMEMDKACLSELRVTTDKLFHLFNLGVRKSYRRLGLAKNLLLESLVVAGDAGYEYAVAETTGVGSQRLTAEIGFHKIKAVPYETFRVGEEFPFREIREPKDCLLMGIEI